MIALKIYYRRKNSTLFYDAKGAENIKKFFAKHTNEFPLLKLNSDGSLSLPQEEHELKKIAKALAEAPFVANDLSGRYKPDTVAKSIGRVCQRMKPTESKTMPTTEQTKSATANSQQKRRSQNNR